jgi:pimeloyl-ACP methyl ester carboxylesterase
LDDGTINIKLNAFFNFQDNCGTFDQLAPLLPKNISLLAIDLPGHGLSSRVPDGMAYHFFDNLFLMHGLIKGGLLGIHLFFF